MDLNDIMKNINKLKDNKEFDTIIHNKPTGILEPETQMEMEKELAEREKTEKNERQSISNRRGGMNRDVFNR